MLRLFIILLLASVVLPSCNNSDSTPKPKAFPRIERVDEGVQKYSGEKFSFTYSAEASVNLIPSDDNSEIWINILYPAYNTTVHCTYVPIDKKRILSDLLNDSHHLAFSHSSKANSIEQVQIENEYKNSGMIYYIDGDVPTPIQFYITDSTSNFFRGSVYYNQSVNRDSVASVTQYMKDDILKLTRSFNWVH